MRALRFTEEELSNYAKRRGRVRQIIAHDEPTPRPRGPVSASKLELRLHQQITDANLPIPRRNHFPILNRDFELDFSWPERKLAVEVQGMAHRIKGKFRADIEKRALCMLAGWRVLEVGGAEIRSGKAIEWLKVLLA